MRKFTTATIIIIGIIIAIYLAFGKQLEARLSGFDMLTISRPAWSLISFSLLSLDIILPVPSSILMTFNGFVLGTTLGSLLSLASLLCSALAGYYLGRLFDRRQKAMQNSRAAALLNRFGAFAIILSRPIPILSETVCILCGYNGMSFRKYLIYILAGSAPISILYAYLGSTGANRNSFLYALIASISVSLIFQVLLYQRKPASSNSIS